MVKKILHVGYKLTDKSLIYKLDPYSTINTDSDWTLYLKPHIYTARMFHKSSSQDEMSMWYNNNKGKNIEGLLYKLYITHKYVVACILLQNKREFLTLRSESCKDPINLKIMATQGAYGQPIDIEPKIKLEFSAYQQTS